MADYPAGGPVTLPLSPALTQHWEDAIVDKGFIETSIDLWQRALEAPESVVTQMSSTTVRTQLVAPLVAPLVSATAPVPRSILLEDGFLPVPEAELLATLDAYAEQVTGVNVITELGFDSEVIPARRVYIFDNPVTVASAQGTLYTRDASGQTVPLAAGMPTQIVIETIVDVAPGGEIIEELTGTFADQTVLWTR